jgi:hypothetical protein
MANIENDDAQLTNLLYSVWSRFTNAWPHSEYPSRKQAARFILLRYLHHSGGLNYQTSSERQDLRLIS